MVKWPYWTDSNSIIRNQWNSMWMCNFSQSVKVWNVKLWISDRFHIYCTGPIINCLFKQFGWLWVNECYGTAQLFQSVFEQFIGSTIQVICRNNIVSHFCNIDYCIKYGRHSWSGCICCGSTFNSCHSFFKCFSCRVCQPCVNVSSFLKRKSVCSLLGRFKYIRGSLINWSYPWTGLINFLLAGMDPNCRYIFFVFKFIRHNNHLIVL